MESHNGNEKLSHGSRDKSSNYQLFNLYCMYVCCNV